MTKHGIGWRLRALEALGYALLAPWLAAHASLVLAGLGWGGRGPWTRSVLAAGTPEAATLVLFVLPALALTLGIAGVHSLLWNSRVRSLLGLLVVFASLCLIGSVIGSVVAHARAGTTAVAPDDTRAGEWQT
jgi:hypothetical protein